MNYLKASEHYILVLPPRQVAMEKLLKISANKIRVATGWERGADNKWRYEIEDIEITGAGHTLDLATGKVHKDMLPEVKNIGSKVEFLKLISSNWPESICC